MAVIGNGGQLRFYRDPPQPVIVEPDSLNINNSSIDVLNPSLWSGDRVQLSCPRGLPFNLTQSGLPENSTLAIPDCPDGYAFYAGSTWLPSGARTHVINNSSRFYKLDNAAPFYVRPIDVGFVQTATFYIYRDQLDRISFYTERSASLRGTASERIPLYNVDFEELTLTYQDPETWSIQSDLTSWTLSLQAPELDTTALGERFSDAIKALISGSGSLDFLIDRKDQEGYKDSTFLLNLLLMTENECKTDAQFWIIQQRADNLGTLLPGDLYYAATLIITNIVINTRSEEIIAGSADFATVGQVALRMGPV